MAATRRGQANVPLCSCQSVVLELDTNQTSASHAMKSAPMKVQQHNYRCASVPTRDEASVSCVKHKRRLGPMLPVGFAPKPQPIS
jgi:hypothetical protein